MRMQLCAVAAIILFITCTSPTSTSAQTSIETNESSEQVPEKVDVEPTAADSAIDARLTRIIKATQWFDAPTIDVRDGVVFIDGQTATQRRRDWAGDLARKTQDVVAVVNRIEVVPTPTWNFTPAWREITILWRKIIQAIPLALFAFIVLPIAWLLSRTVARLARYWLKGRVGSPLLARVLARAIAIPFSCSASTSFFRFLD